MNLINKQTTADQFIKINVQRTIQVKFKIMSIDLELDRKLLY